MVRSTTELVTRAKKEFEDARSALLQLESQISSEARRLEASLRRGETPQEMQPAENRAAIVQRTAACEAALNKFQAEDRDAQARLATTVGAVRSAATVVLATYLELEIEKLRRPSKPVSPSELIWSASRSIGTGASAKVR